MIELKKYWINKKNLIKWQKEPKIAYLKRPNNKTIWFPDGKLNVAQNCLESVRDNKKLAIITIDKNKNIEKYTYSQIFGMVNEFSNFLEKLDKKAKVKNILIHSSASIVSAVSMLSCAKLGIHFSVVFEDLPDQALDIRVKLIKPDIVITRSKEKCNFFIESLRKNNLKKSILINSNNKSKNKKIDYFNFKIYKPNLKTNFTYVNSNKILFTLFTSGSTGEPKGIQHSSGGYLLYSKYTCIKQFGMTHNSVVLVASDAGWINGHTYALFGPLSNGSTTILLEKPLTLIDYNFLNQIIKKFKVSILYLPVTLIRLLKGLVPTKKTFYNNYLKTIGSMGEPLAESVGLWYSKLFFKKLKPVVNTYFQTETGGIIASPKYNEKAKSTFGTVGKPINKFMSFANSSKRKFELKISNPWPGCMINVINGQKYWKKYWDKNKFNLFDIGTYVNKKLVIYGRSDDVINIRGHRLGSGEVESKLLEIKYLLEVCAISEKDYLQGSNIIIFATLKDNTSSNKAENLINKKIIDFFGSWALPKRIYIVNQLPKTKSGKILRRVIRNIYIDPSNKNYGDLSTIINKSSIEDIKRNVIND